MPKIKYRDLNLAPKSLELVEKCNTIIAEYARQGFDLTLRQLYYQLVSRDIIPNKVTEYKRLGSIVNDARLCGLIDWNAIVDRTRNMRQNSHWASPSDIVSACASQFQHEKWADQKYRPEVWIEKDALVGVIEGICQELDVPFFSCRGYTSQSEMWAGAMRLKRHVDMHKKPVIIHLGDHDPSGKDMTRDILDRMEMFVGQSVPVERIALNMDQIRQYNPPPNPAKETDSRCRGYVAEYGDESWELDALEPTVLAALIRDAVTQVCDQGRWKKAKAREEAARAQLRTVANQWEEIVEAYGS